MNYKSENISVFSIDLVNFAGLERHNLTEINFSVFYLIS